MIKVFVGEFECFHESSPYGGFSFEVADEQELTRAINELREEYPGGVRRSSLRERSENERCYRVYSCGGECDECD